MGFDDLRDLQPLKRVFDDEGKFSAWECETPLPIYGKKKIITFFLLNKKRQRSSYSPNVKSTLKQQL